LHIERELTVHVLHIIHFTWVRPVLAQTKCVGRVRPPKRRERKYVGPISAQSFWGLYRPTVSGFMSGPVIWAGPAHLF
jgi:hypothetical protein